MSRLVLALVLAAAPASTVDPSSRAETSDHASIEAAPRAVPVGEVARSSIELPAQPVARMAPAGVPYSLEARPSPVLHRREPRHRSGPRRRVPRMGNDEPPAC